MVENLAGAWVEASVYDGRGVTGNCGMVSKAILNDEFRILNWENLKTAT
jgi:hypothetical protein